MRQLSILRGLGETTEGLRAACASQLSVLRGLGELRQGCELPVGQRAEGLSSG